MRRRLLLPALPMLPALLLAACTGTGPPPLSDDEMQRRLGDAAPYLRFYAGLDALETSGDPVTVLQIGDSHTANDAFSGRMRELLQAHFGNGGRGILPPGIPFRTYRPAQVTVTALDWTVVSSFSYGRSGPFGITGLRQHADMVAEMTLTARESGDLAHVWAEALVQPGGGMLSLQADTGAITEVTTGGATGPEVPQRSVWIDLAAGIEARSVTLRSRGDGPVDVLAWGADAATSGLRYGNLGTIGATINLLSRWDQGLVAAEMERLRPALLLVAFGSNEGYDDTVDPKTYGRTYAAAIQALRRAAPDAAITLMGPPDGTRRARAGRPGEACPADDAVQNGSTWVIPPRLAMVRAEQRRVAGANGCDFWDWAEAMGGACSINRWAAATPPMAAPDHLHLLTAGYRATAEQLFRHILRGYGQYRIVRAVA